MTTLSSNLHRPDHAVWRLEPHYNPAVRAPLIAGYVHLQQAPDRVASFRDAGYHILAVRDLPMCHAQSMNAWYILAMAYAADDEYTQALSALDQALDCASALCDRPAELDLLFLRGFISQRIGRFDHALRDYRDALSLHAQLRRTYVPVDGEQELMLLIGAAGFALMQEDYDLTRRLISLARRAARRVPASPLTIAYHDWLWGVYLHARGKSTRALQHALRAAHAFTVNGGNPHSIVLVHVFVARIALSLACEHPADSIGRVAHLKVVALSLRTARKALVPNNSVGKAYIQARQAQLDELRGRWASALKRIRAAEHLARNLGDEALLVQVLTTYGYIVAQRQDLRACALAKYREAAAISQHSSFSLEGLPARRELRRLEEVDVNMADN